MAAFVLNHDSGERGWWAVDIPTAFSKSSPEQFISKQLSNPFVTVVR